tara:strand:- start:55 stop:1242 length:1188 start_codon:yes stop_codon:yes gene_type:complete
MALGRFLDKLKGVVAPIAKVAAPIVGSVVAGPVGGILAGGLTKGLTTKGSFGDKLKGGLKGAAIGAATTGAMSALKGAVTGSQAAGAVTDPAAGILAKQVPGAAVANPALAQAGNAANTAAKAALAPGASMAQQSAAEQLANQQITVPSVTASAPAVTGSVTRSVTPANQWTGEAASVGTRVNAQVADNPAGQRFLNIQNDMRNQRAAEAARTGGRYSPDRLEAMRQFNREEVAPTMFNMVEAQDQIAQQASLARPQALADLAQGDAPLRQFNPMEGLNYQSPTAVTPTTPNLEVPTFETPGIDVTMPEPPSFTSLAPPPMMIEQGSGRNRLMSMFSGIGNFAKENPELAMGIAQGLQGAFAQDPRERELEYQMKLRARKADLIRQMGLLDDFSV